MPRRTRFSVLAVAVGFLLPAACSGSKGQTAAASAPRTPPPPPGSAAANTTPLPQSDSEWLCQTVGAASAAVDAVAESVTGDNPETYTDGQQQLMSWNSSFMVRIARYDKADPDVRAKAQAVADRFASAAVLLDPAKTAEFDVEKAGLQQVLRDLATVCSRFTPAGAQDSGAPAPLAAQPEQPADAAQVLPPAAQ